MSKLTFYFNFFLVCPGLALLVGNSIGADKMFLDKYIPRFMAAGMFPFSISFIKSLIYAVVNFCFIFSFCVQVLLDSINLLGYCYSF
jgi:hypothetical protein